MLIKARDANGDVKNIISFIAYEDFVLLLII